MEDRIAITCKIEHETAKAVLINDGGQRTWLPKSVVELANEPDGTAVLYLPEWLAVKRGLI